MNRHIYMGVHSLCDLKILLVERTVYNMSHLF